VRACVRACVRALLFCAHTCVFALLCVWQSVNKLKKAIAQSLEPAKD
jgi:hypothetical protein